MIGTGLAFSLVMPDPTPRERLLAVARALERIEVAIEALAEATPKLRAVLPTGHPAVEAASDAGMRAMQARAKLEAVYRRLP